MSVELINQELEKAQINLIKITIYNFIKKEFGACDTFYTGLMECKTTNEIKRLLIKYRNDIFETLGGEDKTDEVKDLESQVSSLEWEVDGLEGQLEELQEEINGVNSKFHGSLFGEYKWDVFQQFYGLYNPWELEELLKNGKQYLEIKQSLELASNFLKKL